MKNKRLIEEYIALKELDKEFHTGIDLLVQEAQRRAKDEVIRDIPYTWLDPMLRDWLNKRDFTPKDIQDIIMKIKGTLTKKHLSPITVKPGDKSQS